MQKPPQAAQMNGPPTPSQTPPVESENKRLSTTPKKDARSAPEFKADIDEGESPPMLATEPTGAAKAETLVLDAPTPKQEEDGDDETKDREGDIYAEAVLACSIENPEACIMCSG